MLGPSIAPAQELPRGATPRAVVYTFLSETASGTDTINRLLFRERMTGELAGKDPRMFKGLLPPNARLRIDTIPDLPMGSDELRRVVAYATVESGGAQENWYLFCNGDTIWRLESFRRFPSPSQRTQILQSLRDIDTTTASFRQLRSDLQRILLSDDSLRSIMRLNRRDAEKVVEPLRKGRLWDGIAIRDVDFMKLEEYRELDDDINDKDRIFYTLDRSALERLKQRIGLRRIERDPRYPDIVLFVIGTLENDSFGYINCSDPSLLPPVSSNGFITLKPIGDHWWFFKRVDR